MLEKRFFNEHLQAKNSIIETCIQTEKDIEKIEKWLSDVSDLNSEEIEQMIFSLRVTLTESLINQCQDATGHFAKNLATRFGEEKSFFDLVSDVEFFDVRSNGPFNNANQRIKYHSVAVMIFKGKSFLICDLTYGLNMKKGKKENIFFEFGFGDIKDIVKELSKKYGGKWDIMYRFNKNNKNFEFID